MPEAQKDPVASPPPPASTPSPPPASAANGQPPANGSPGTPPVDPGKPAGDPGKSGTLYTDAGIDEPGKEGSNAWPTDWREQMAAGDAKAAEALKRFQNPGDVAKSFLAAQQRIRSGEYKRDLPASDKPEDLKAWREERGIPDEPSAYELPLVPGVDMENLDDDSKAAIGLLQTGLHTANLTKEQGAVVAKAIADLGLKQMETLAQKDAANKDNHDDALRAAWGAEYRANMMTNVAFLKKHYGDSYDQITEARTPDGRRLGDIPEWSKAINAWARTEGGDVLFAGEGTAVKGIDARIAEIKHIMNTDFARYSREKLGDEYSELLAKKNR